MESLAIPEAVAPFAGRIIDVDSHEMMPAQVWVETFGEVARPFAELVMKAKPDNPNHANVPTYAGDVLEIAPETIWTTKGPGSPGSVDPKRRTAVMDLIGIGKQLMFPTSVGLWGHVLFTTPASSGVFPQFDANRRDYAKQLFAANNRWAVEAARASDRVRPVAPVYGDTVEELVSVTRGLLDQGIRAVWLLSSVPPCGLSPAHPDLDPFYSLLAEAGVPLTLHLGSENGFLATEEWRNAPAFEGYKTTGESRLDPWTLSSFHLACQNFTATMVTGGVFERHPSLRFGVLEVSAHWIGPLAAMLDVWHENNQSIGIKKFGEWEGRKLPLKPSEYIRRNVRVSAFEFEPVDEYIDRYGLEEVYCFASDYPHVEGGKNPMGRWADRLQRLGPSVMEKFYVTNGELLLP